jgi:hypothetical protein
MTPGARGSTSSTSPSDPDMEFDRFIAARSSAPGIACGGLSVGRPRQLYSWTAQVAFDAATAAAKSAPDDTRADTSPAGAAYAGDLQSIRTILSGRCGSGSTAHETLEQSCT